MLQIGSQWWALKEINHLRKNRFCPRRVCELIWEFRVHFGQLIHDKGSPNCPHAGHGASPHSINSAEENFFVPAVARRGLES